MSEAEWLANSSLWSCLSHVEGDWGDRKSRLLAVAACRRIWDLISCTAAMRCVEVAELYADGLVSQDALDDAIQASIRDTEAEYRTRTADGHHWGEVERAAINAVSRVHRSSGGGRFGTFWGAQTARAFNTLSETRGTGELGMNEQTLRPLVEREEAQQLAFLRDIYGNPFRPVTIHPPWLTETVVSLATGIYAERAFDRMPILADVLEEAGCDNAEVLNHCRGDRPHVRGCWVVDLVLGKG